MQRRTVLLSIASAFAAAACGGTGSDDSGQAQANARQLASPPTAPARLTLAGSQMYDPSGKAIQLRGINEGTWGKMRSYDATTIASYGGNVVRVLIRWWGLYGGTDVESRDDPSPGHFKPDHLTEFLQNVQWCIDAGLWVVPVIDSNCGQNGLQNADTVLYCDPTSSYPGGHNFWTDLDERARFKEAWVYLAGILKSYERIAFYELLPEPLQNHNATWAPAVSSFYQELMTAIETQAGDTRTPFLVGARDAYNINLCDEAYIADPHWTNRVVYTGDLFVHVNSTNPADVEASIDSRLGALVSMKTKRNVPVFVQQYGVRTGDDKDGSYLAYGLRQMNAAGVGYTGWQWRQNTTSPDEYALVLDDPVTGGDIYKQPQLSIYSQYWTAPRTAA